MIDLIIVILLCALLLGGVFDWLFNLVGVGVKIFLSIVLILAAIYLGIKVLVVMIPWMFIISIIALIVGIVWLVKSIFR